MLLFAGAGRVPVPCPTFQRRKANRANSSSPSRTDRTMIHHGTPPYWAACLSGKTVSLTWGTQIPWQNISTKISASECQFLFPLFILHTILLRFVYVHVCNILTSAFELSCNAINNHFPVLGPVVSHTVYITCVSAFCSTVFFAVLSICREAFTITST